jgi:hypothetical protein
MDRKTVALVTAVAAALLCGCPGFFGLFMGGLFAVISFIPGADLDVFGSADPQAALNFGLASLCIGGVGVLIAIGAAVWAWRSRSAQA